MRDKGYFMKHSLFHLRLINIWPAEGHTNTKMFYFKAVLTLVLASPFWIGLLFHTYFVVKDNLDVPLAGDISVIASVAGLQYMLNTFLWGHQNISHLFQSLTDFSFGKPDNFDTTFKKVNLYSKMYSAWCHVGLVIYIILKIFDIPDCMQNNYEKNLNEICGTIIPIWLPVYANSITIRSVVLVSQAYSVTIIICGGAAMSFTTFEAASAIALKIQHFKKLVREIFNEGAVTREDIVKSVRYHYHIIQLQDLFDSRYKYCMGSYVLMIGIILAGLFNQYQKENNLGALIHLSGWVISFFVSCHAGQLIISESSSIAPDILNTRWYEVPVTFQRDLLIMIVRAQQPLLLHAAPIGVMNYDLFITLGKTSYSYFTLLSNST